MSPRGSEAGDPGFWQPRDALGVVLAGGASRRFGRDKAIHPVAGRSMAHWSLDALRRHTAEQVVIANAPGVARELGVRGRPDVLPGLGPLGGLLTALEWAREEGRIAVFLLACDLPLVTSSLVNRILMNWEPGSTAVVPGSPGPLGFEPLCGAYAVGILDGARERAFLDDRSMEGVLAKVEATVVPVKDLGPAEELEVAFKNVNTEPEARWAEKVLLERASSFDGLRSSPGRGK